MYRQRVRAACVCVRSKRQVVWWRAVCVVGGVGCGKSGVGTISPLDYFCFTPGIGFSRQVARSA